MARPEKLRVVKLDEVTLTELRLLSKLYADVFAPPPWNEAVRCRSCDVFKGRDVEVGSLCNCGGIYVEAYPESETVNYITNSEGRNPDFRLVLAENGSLIGFSWSYLVTPDTFVDHKWKLESDRCNVMDILSENGVSEETTFRYFSECGVIPEARGKGLANKLTEAGSGPETTVYRTNCNSPMMAVAKRLGFIQVMGPEIEVDRAKNIVKTGRIINCLDQGNKDRTLFVRKALV